MKNLTPIEQKRRIAKLTQEEAADAVGMSRRHYGAIEKYAHLPSVGLGIRIARLFNTSVEQLWGQMIE